MVASRCLFSLDVEYDLEPEVGCFVSSYIVAVNFLELAELEDRALIFCSGYRVPQDSNTMLKDEANGHGVGMRVGLISTGQENL